MRGSILAKVPTAPEMAQVELVQFQKSDFFVNRSKSYQERKDVVNGVESSAIGSMSAPVIEDSG